MFRSLIDGARSNGICVKAFRTVIPGHFFSVHSHYMLFFLKSIFGFKMSYFGFTVAYCKKVCERWFSRVALNAFTHANASRPVHENPKYVSVTLEARNLSLVIFSVHSHSCYFSWNPFLASKWVCERRFSRIALNAFTHIPFLRASSLRFVNMFR